MLRSAPQTRMFVAQTVADMFVMSVSLDPAATVSAVAHPFERKPSMDVPAAPESMNTPRLVQLSAVIFVSRVPVDAAMFKPFAYPSIVTPSTKQFRDSSTNTPEPAPPTAPRPRTEHCSHPRLPAPMRP